MKKNLVWCSVASLESCTPELFGPEREFDVVLHYYAGDNSHVPLKDDEILIWNGGVTHYKSHGTEKLVAAAKLIPDLPGYEQYAFLDDDLYVSTDTLNQVFRVGKAARLPLYQPALTKTSICGWEFLRSLFDPTRPGEKFYEKFSPRKVQMVEVMMPFFSRDALVKCLPTFDFNFSGWGTDVYQWPPAVDYQMFVLDWLTVGHYTDATRRQRILPNGLTPWQEYWISQIIFDPNPPSIFPPGWVKHDALECAEIECPQHDTI